MKGYNSKKIPGISLAMLLFLSITFAGVSGCTSNFLFYPNSRVMGTPEDIGLTYSPVFFTTEDGVRLHAWWVPAKNARATLLFCHGNAGNITYRLESIRLFHRLGLNVFIFDYRGYGRSKGSPSEKGTYRDVAAAWKYLTKKRRIGAKKIILFGRSLGGPIAARCAAKNRPAMLVLESTFTCAADVAHYHYPVLPASCIFGDTYNAAAFITKVTCPVLIIHSPDDEIIPFSLGKRLFSLARGSKKFVKIRGPHNGGFMESMKVYYPALSSFITENVR